MSITTIAAAAKQGERGRFMQVGDAVFIQTATHYWFGRVDAVYAEYGHAFVSLTEAAWVPETARFSDFLGKGALKSVEPCAHKIDIAMQGVMTWTSWPHKLPRTAK